MAKQNLNIGVSANDGTGDTLRDGAIKVNNVINEMYAALGDNTNLQISIGSPSTNQVLKWNGSVFTEGQLAASNLTDVDVSGLLTDRFLSGILQMLAGSQATIYKEQVVVDLQSTT